jgi:[acyl-carrier-protein] S-malonyltransferase
MTRIALCFPGQGSQAPGMAAGLDRHAGGRRLLDAAAADGLDLGGALNGDAAMLRSTDIAQPGLLLVETVLAAAIRHRGQIVGVAGHSVGEYAALVVAGVLDPAEAMRLVVARGRAMAAMREGGMLALLGCDDGRAARICELAQTRADGIVVIANYNAPGQIVLSGSAAGITAATGIAAEMGVRRVMPLNVSGAFHSPLMRDAASVFSAALDGVRFSNARIPVVCNVDAEAVTDGEGLRDRLRRQLEAPVRWSDSVATLVGGLAADVLVEVGPGAVLTGLAKRITPRTTLLAVDSLDAAASLDDRLGALTHG